MDVVVGYVHSSGIGNLSVDDDNLTVVAMEDVVDVWEMEWVENIELYATGTLIQNVLFLKRTVVARVSEGVVYGTYLYALAGFFCKEVEECICYGVVAEIEVFEMHAMPRLSDSCEHILKLLRTICEECYAIVVGECHALFPHYIDDEGVGGWGLGS